MVDEKTLQEHFQSEDPSAAAAELFQLYSDRIYHLALGLLGDVSLAEDVVQETFLSAIKNRRQFQGRSSLSTWLYRIAYNEAHEILRKRTELPLEEEHEEDDETAFPHPIALVDWRMQPEQMLADNELRRQMDQAVKDLPGSLKSVFLLRDVDDLSTEDTAETLGISPGAVKVRLHRARLFLRERLSGYLANQPGTTAEMNREVPDREDNGSHTSPGGEF